LALDEEAQAKVCLCFARPALCSAKPSFLLAFFAN